LFPKTPVGTTPNQRRKTWCFNTEPNNKSKSVRTPIQSGITKRGNLTDKQTRKSCSFINWNKDLVDKNANVASSPTSNRITGITEAMQEEKNLIQSLEKCCEMFEVMKSTDIFFQNMLYIVFSIIL
jgi:hypothetical protein